MQLFLKTLNASTLPVEIDGDATVLEMRKEIERRHKIPLDSQILIFCGAHVPDDKTVMEMEFHKHCCVHLIIRPSDLIFDPEPVPSKFPEKPVSLFSSALKAPASSLDL
jgi:hypothetical protein